MKIVLGLSLLINIILGVLYFQKESLPPIERIVVEQVASPKDTNQAHVEEKIGLPVAEVAKPKTSLSTTVLDDDSSKLVEEVSEQVSNDRASFLTEKLNLSQQDMDQIEKIKDRFFKKMQMVHHVSMGGDLSVDQRRRMLEVETERDREFEKMMGKAKWEKFQKFKSDYNKKKFEEQASGFGVVVPLDI